jgi:hypothetical protein
MATIREKYVLLPKAGAELSSGARSDLQIVAADLHQMTSDWLEGNLFRGARRLRLVNIAPCIKTIDDECFLGCESLISAPLHDCTKLEVIGEGAFWDCYALTGVILPASTLKVEDSAFCFSGMSTFDFAACPDVAFGEGVLFGSRVAQIRTGIKTSVALRKGLSKMVKRTCVDRISTEMCATGEDVPISEAVSRVASRAFNTVGSDSIEVSWRGGGIRFSRATPVTERIIVVGDDPPLTTYSEIVVMSEVLPKSLRGELVRALDLRAAGAKCLAGLELKKIVPRLGRLVLPTGIEAVSRCLCEDLTGLNTVLARHSTVLGKIEWSAFDSCVSLRKFLMPDSITTIGGGAFTGSGLRDLDLTDRSLSNARLFGMIWLENLRLPPAVKTVDFSGAASLRTLVTGHFEADEPYGCTGGRPTTIHFRSFDAGVPPSFALVVEKAHIFAEVVALAGRATRPLLSLGI